MTIRLMALLLLLFPVTACGVMPPLIYVEVTVVDDDDKPVEGADAFVAPFVNPVTQTRIQKDVITPENGRFRVSGFPRDASFYIGASKESYYDSRIRVGIEKYLGPSGGEQILYLREKRNPTALYAKRQIIDMPVLGPPIGYDFFVGDLVWPGHKGKEAHIYLQVDTLPPPQDVSPRIRDRFFHHVLTVSFPNEGDGILFTDPHLPGQYSKFKSHYLAPASGYQSSGKIEHYLSEEGYRGVNLRRDSYLVIRSVIDNEGNVLTANYCKILPGFYVGFRHGELVEISFAHYCNPTPNDRNVEFDPEQNLLKFTDPSNNVVDP